MTPTEASIRLARAEERQRVFASTVKWGEGTYVAVMVTRGSPSSWPIGNNVLWETDGRRILFMWQPDRRVWTNFGEIHDEA